MRHKTCTSRAVFATIWMAAGLSTAVAAPVVPDAGALMDWAERSYPQFFPGPQPTQTLAPYVFRHYPGTGNYLGVAGSAVYVLGPAVGNSAQPQYVGELWAFACLVNPAGCVGVPDGANDCMDMTFTRASTYQLKRRHTMPGGVGFDVVESRAPVQPAVFRGRSLLSWQLVHESTGPGAGDGSRTEDTHYFERAGERAVAFHGQVQDTTSTASGRQTVSRTEYVWEPAWMSYLAALSPGQSYTVDVTSQTTQTVNGVTTGPAVDTARYRSRFVGYETLQTAAGSFAACRFEDSAPDMPGATTTVWVWRGWGIELEREVTIVTGAGGSFTERWLLQSLTVNGQRAP